MHNNFYFLRQISILLDARLGGKTLLECFSQNAGELILGFGSAEGNDDFYMQAACTPSLAAVWFPTNFARARRNTANLFENLIGQKINKVVQYENERAFELFFESQSRVKTSLIFKLFGSKSNVLLCENGQVIDMLHSRRVGDRILAADNLHQPSPNLDFAGLLLSQLPRAWPTLGKPALHWLTTTYPDFDTLEPDLRAQILADLQSRLLAPSAYYIQNEKDGAASLSFFKLDNDGQVLVFNQENGLEAASRFVSLWHKQNHFAVIKKTLTKTLEQDLKVAKKSVEHIEIQIQSAQKRASYRLQADLIMAYSHQILDRQSQIVLPDFQTNLPITIGLDAQLSPMANAEKYYRKAAKEHKFSDLLYQNLEKKQSRIELVQSLLARLDQISELSGLQILAKDAYFAANPAQVPDAEARPYYPFMIDGFEVWVGKNARANDLMLSRHSRKDDLWLHARGYAGSHVIVRRKSPAPVPQPVIERAASLAAFYSKGKTNDFCPVICTFRKYVRKPKGATPGMVRVEREDQVLLVRPGKPES